eukprot:363566-Chlamydomonas_euryale.AAC.5
MASVAATVVRSFQRIPYLDVRATPQLSAHGFEVDGGRAGCVAAWWPDAAANAGMGSTWTRRDVRADEERAGSIVGLCQGGASGHGRAVLGGAVTGRGRAGTGTSRGRNVPKLVGLFQRRASGHSRHAQHPFNPHPGWGTPL